MKYTKEITDKLIEDYKKGITVHNLAVDLEVPERSIIAKLSSLGVYQKKQYLNKRGEVPIKKSEHIDRLAELLDVPPEQLESLEKVNKQVLVLLEKRLGATDPKPHQLAT